tara:strand:- start:1153 stop:1311 length:159 start_codon:yes stop_codon:yes gene_type:complete
MDATHGFIFFLLGTTLTILGFGVAFYFASRPKKKEIPKDWYENMGKNNEVDK